jgi:hypothetical protein
MCHQAFRVSITCSSEVEEEEALTSSETIVVRVVVALEVSLPEQSLQKFPLVTRYLLATGALEEPGQVLMGKARRGATQERLG